MTLDGTIVVSLIVLMIIALAKEMLRPGLVLFTAASLMMAVGIISAQETVAGFANIGMLTVAILFLVSEGIRQTGALNRFAQFFLPRRRGRIPFMLLRTMLPVSFLSAFLNNTPIVIIFGPMIKKWAEKLNLSSQKFLIPLSYATIFGGMCTLIGTSTNLVVHGLMIDNGLNGFSMFELGKIGIPVLLVGTIYVAIFGNLLLPGRKIKFNKPARDYREYFYDLIVTKSSTLIGVKVRCGRIKELKNLILHSIERDGKVLTPNHEGIIIQENDILLIAGKSDSLNQILSLDSVKLRGIDELKGIIPKSELRQYEAVIAPRFPGIGQTISDFNFVEHYKAVVLAIHRNGERLTSNLGHLRLKPGDSLVLLTDDKFIRNWGESKIFYLTSYIGEHSSTNGNTKRWAALILLLLMIAGATFGKYIYTPRDISFDMFYFAALVAVLMVWLKILPAQQYTKAISWDILITIAMSLAISKAMQNSGAADALARTTINFSKSFGPIGVLAAVYLITTIFTEIITNNAAAALVFPIAFSAANQMGIDPKPLFVAIAMAASASFSTPIGYQTNLIVQGIGNYKFNDYLKIGLPLNIICFLLSLAVIPYFWEF
jgi:di/tricarboxylate transporter